MAVSKTIKGFTLMEMLIAISIISIIIGALYGAYISNVRGIQITRQDSQVYQTARIVLDRMRRDLECAYLGSGASKKSALGMIAEDIEIEDSPADKIDFTALTHIYSKQDNLTTDLCEIGYFLKKEPDTNLFILYRRDSGIVDNELCRGGRIDELAYMVKGLELEFIDKQGNSFKYWNSLKGDYKNILPSLIKIKLILSDKNGGEHVFTTAVHPELSPLIITDLTQKHT